MPEFGRLTRPGTALEWDSAEREATPEPLMKPGVRLHATGLSLSDTVSVLDNFGVDRCRTTVHDGTWKADLQAADGKSTDHVGSDETAIRPSEERSWLSAAVDPETTDLLPVRLHPARPIALTERVLHELQEKHDVDDGLFPVDGAPWLQATLLHRNLGVQRVTRGTRNAVERGFEAVTRGTTRFVDHFRRPSAKSVEP